MDKTVFSYLIVINILSFILFGYDKYLAVHHKWRISEKNLLLSSAVGGSFGAYAAMHIFHHKTKHRKFTLLVPIFALLHTAIIIFLLYRSF